MFGVKTLESRSSKYNKEIKVVKSWGMGTYIQVNGLTQSGGVVTTIWKPVIKKIKKENPNLSKFLILGLGGGTVASLIQKYWEKANITGVEIDKNMVDLGVKYLNLDKDNITIFIKDALKFKQDTYDLIIVDTYLGDAYIEIPKVKKYNAKITIFNRLFYGDKKDSALKFGEKLKKRYKRVEVFYPQANIMFICYD